MKKEESVKMYAGLGKKHALQMDYQFCCNIILKALIELINNDINMCNCSLGKNWKTICISVYKLRQIRAHKFQMKYKRICVSFFLVNDEIKFVRVSFYRN